MARDLVAERGSRCHRCPWKAAEWLSGAAPLSRGTFDWSGSGTVSIKHLLAAEEVREDVTLGIPLEKSRRTTPSEGKSSKVLLRL